MSSAFKPWQLSYWSQTWQQMQVSERKQFGWLLLIHFVLCALFISRQGVLFDESDYYAYAVNWIKGDNFRHAPIMDSKTPMTAVSLGALVFRPFLPGRYLQNDYFLYLKLGRIFMYVYQALGMFAVCCWLYRKCGKNKWLIPLALYAFDPLVFSYSMVIGSDLASASFLVAGLYSLWRFTITSQRRYLFYMSVAIALAVVTKASMLYCYPLLLLLLLLKRRSFVKAAPAATFKSLLIFLLIQLLVINAAYYGIGSFTSIGNLPLASLRFTKLQSSLHAISWLPVPLPAAFIQGIDMLQQHAEWGGCSPESTYSGVWLFSKVWCNQSVWYYYIATALFKLPLFTWLLTGIALVRFAATRYKLKTLSGEIFLWLPFFYFLIILSVANKFQIGIRHAIILLPFLYIAISDAVAGFYDGRKRIFVVLLALNFISIAKFLPNILAYTNELLWNKTKAFHVIRDSSLDYGQSRPWVKDFIAMHPEYKVPTNKPAAGRFAITVGDLYAEHDGEQKNIAWLRNNFEPTGSYLYTILLFEVTDADLKAKNLVSGE